MFQRARKQIRQNHAARLDGDDIINRRVNTRQGRLIPRIIIVTRRERERASEGEMEKRYKKKKPDTIHCRVRRIRRRLDIYGIFGLFFFVFSYRLFGSSRARARVCAIVHVACLLYSSLYGHKIYIIVETCLQTSHAHTVLTHTRRAYNTRHHHVCTYFLAASESAGRGRARRRRRRSQTHPPENSENDARSADTHST